MADAEKICKVQVALRNRDGLHARPAHLFVQTANAYASRIHVRRQGEDEQVDGKSIMGMMMLAAERGAMLELHAEGPDADQQVRALVELVEAGFGEE
jgi:phosphotransferase system HPr (HPr) family protein